VNEYNSIPFAWLQELEAKCTMESQLKEGKILLTFCLIILSKESQLKEGKILLTFCLIILSYLSILWTDHDLYCRV
jgi:hypothetical protein